MSAAGEVTDIGVVQNDDDGPRPNQQIIDVILPTYIMKPEETELFYPSVVKKIADEVLLKFLDKQDFDEDESKTWILKISEEIKARVKSECNIPRYKVVVQVTLGQMKDQGVRVASRCLWDTSTDNYASTRYQNQSLWCCAMIFGLYCE